MNSSDEYVILVAGGSGKRMGKPFPKQFIELLEKPILQHTIEAFYAYNPQIKIIISLHPDYIDYWKKVSKTQNTTIDYTIVKGGETRFHSVKNALVEIKSDGIIAVHDAVRPLLNIPFLDKLFKDARKFGSAIPVLPSKDSLRKINSTENISVPRAEYFLVQSPQLFHSKILLKAYKQCFQESFTDDASVAEHLGFSVHTSVGLEENIKITTPLDIELAKIILTKRKRLSK
jgi:2-C-methyl-D-erythritol 4-phosphate cytidylyltransferase